MKRTTLLTLLMLHLGQQAQATSVVIQTPRTGQATPDLREATAKLSAAGARTINKMQVRTHLQHQAPEPLSAFSWALSDLTGQRLNGASAQALREAARSEGMRYTEAYVLRSKSAESTSHHIHNVARQLGFEEDLEERRTQAGMSCHNYIRDDGEVLLIDHLSAKGHHLLVISATTALTL